MTHTVRGIGGFRAARWLMSSGALVSVLVASTAHAQALPAQVTADTTLTLAGSPYVISGDVEVMPGVTLTIEPGTVLEFQTGPDQPTGWFPGFAELIVDGTLVADGPTSAPVTFEGTTPGIAHWGGLMFTSGAAASLGNATVTDAIVGIRQLAYPASTLALDHVNVWNCNAGVHATYGDLTLDSSTIHDNFYGVINIGTASVALSNLVVYNNSVTGIDLEGSVASTIINSTLDNNGLGITASGPVSVKNSIISGGSSAISGSSVTVTYSDIWGEPVSPYASGVGCMALDPLFVGTGDYHLQAGSPVIDAGDAAGAPSHDRDDVARPLDGDGDGSAEWDLGAYEAPAVMSCPDGDDNCDCDEHHHHRHHGHDHDGHDHDHDHGHGHG